MGSLSSILQRDRILSSFSMGMQKAIEGQAEKGLMLPLPLPPLFCSSSASLECAKKRRDISGEAHLTSSCSCCKIAQSFATMESREKWTGRLLPFCIMQRERKEEIYEAASAHFNNEAAFSISHPSFDASLEPARELGARFSPLITGVFIILLIRRSANLHLNQGLLWRRRRRRKSEANNQPTN